MRHRRERWKARHSKGRENEAKVGRALRALVEQGYIDSYFISTPNGAQDRNGIDAGLMTVHGTEICFQIKSSERGKQRHLRKHPGIPCVNVHGCVTVREVAVLIRTQFELSRR